MKRFSTSHLITPTMRRAWMDTQEEQDYSALTVTNPEPCACGSGELADIYDEPAPICVVCFWALEKEMMQP